MEAEVRGPAQAGVAPTHAMTQDADLVISGLYRAHALTLVRAALLIVGDQGSAEDVVQDAFLAVHRRWSRLADRGEVLPYLRTAVVNGCRSVLRRRRSASLIRVTPEPPVWSAESAVMLSEDRRAVLAAIKRLPRRQREVLVLRYYLDMPETEAAETLRVSRGTVSSSLSRALATLGRALKEDQ
jgi:RNA polymerase sigma-70 factor (sigma-E family)